MPDFNNKENKVKSNFSRISISLASPEDITERFNDDLERCTEEMHQTIRAAHRAPVRNKEFIGEIVRSLGKI